MAAGIRVVNTSNTIQIDETYRNLMLKEVRPLSLTKDHTGLFRHTLSVTGTFPVVAFRAAGPVGPYVASGNVAGSTFSFNLIFYEPGGTSNPSATVFAYIFDVVDSPAGSFGMKVRGPDGTLIFDALRKPMKIVAKRSWADNWAGQAGRLYAAVPVVHQFNTFTPPPQPSRTVMVTTLVRPMDGNVGFIPFSAELGTTTAGGTSLPGEYLVIDVTNY